jgi:uncharacterized RDD family membrane protein YckC
MKKYKKASHVKRLKAFLIDVFLPLKWLLLTIPLYLIFSIPFIAGSGFSEINFESTKSLNKSFLDQVISIKPLATIVFIIIILAFIFSLFWLINIVVKQIKQISKTGQTLGKKKMNLQVVDLRTNKPVSFEKYFVSRTLIYLLLPTGLFGQIGEIFFLIDSGLVLLDKNHDALHDKIWKTRVIDLS